MSTLQSYIKQLDAMSEEVLETLKNTTSPFKSFYKAFIHVLVHLKETEEGILDTDEGSDGHRDSINRVCRVYSEAGIGLLRNLNIIVRFTPVTTLSKMLSGDFSPEDAGNFMKEHPYTPGKDRLAGFEPAVEALSQIAKKAVKRIDSITAYHFTGNKSNSSAGMDKFGRQWANFTKALCVAYNSVASRQDIGLASEIRNYLWRDFLSDGSAPERFYEFARFLSDLEGTSMKYSLEALVKPRKLTEEQVAGVFIDAWTD